MRQELRTVQGRFCFCWARSQGVGIIVTWSAFITGPGEVSEDRSEAVSLRLCRLNWYYFLTLMWAIITTVTVQSWHDQLTGAASVYQSTTSSSSSWGMNADPVETEAPKLNGEVKKYKHLYFAELQWDGLAKYNSRNSSSTSSSEFVLIWSDLIQPADEQSQPGAGRSKRKPNRTFELTHIAVLWSYSLCGAINIWQEKRFLRYFSVIFKYIWY